jgi:hypothetical protein
MNLEEYRFQFKENDPVGWDFITKEFIKIYSDQIPKHNAPVLPYILGGEDPLDGISVYESVKGIKHFHFVTYGFSELYYSEENVGEDFSKFGFELTFRLKMESENENINWACNFLQNIAKYVFKSGKWFDQFHHLSANGPIRIDCDTEITALALVLDPELGKMETPHGEVMFLQIVGLTTSEYAELKQSSKNNKVEELIEKLKKDNEFLVTDLSRV